VFEDGAISGTLGTADLNDEAQKIALELMRKRKSATLSVGEAPIELFFEVHGPPPSLIVFGAGHVSMPLVSLAHDLGLKTIVVDGRPRFATRERFPEVDELLIGIPSEIAQTLSYNSSTFVVLTAHDYKYDLPVLKVVLPAGAAYIGLLGSKRRGKAIKDFLKESGIDGIMLQRFIAGFLSASFFEHNRVLENVRASVAPSSAAPLLGQTFLQRFSSWSIDNERQVLLLREKDAMAR